MIRKGLTNLFFIGVTFVRWYYSCTPTPLSSYQKTQLLFYNPQFSDEALEVGVEWIVKLLTYSEV